nr:hypothetical protein [Phocaeicola sp.]
MMNDYISLVETTLFSATHPDIVKRTNISSVLISLALCVIGAGAFMISLNMADSSSAMSMLLITVGIILLLWAVFRLFWRSKEWVYVPTGSAMKEGTCFLEDLPAMRHVLEKKDFMAKNNIRLTANGNVRMDYMVSRDKKFVAVQLFRFIPYTYEPASPVFYFTGNDANAFVQCLKTSNF